MSPKAELLEQFGLWDMINGRITDDPLEWIEANINLSNDPSSDAEGFIKLAPYQIAPFLAQFKEGIEEVIIMGPEQFGKSIIWKMGMLFKMYSTDEPKLIVYENDDKAEDINKKSFHPLVMLVEKFKTILDNNYYAYKGRQYDLNGQIVDFCGAGADLTTFTKAEVVLDETDTWPLSKSKAKAQVENARKRRRRYAAKGQGCMTICSSPKGTQVESVIWSRFELAQQNYFTLACLGCNELTMPSWDTKALKYHVVRPGVIEDIKLICPECNRVHTFEDAFEMTGKGDYIMTNDEGIYADKRQAFQFGGLSNPSVMSWHELASVNEQYKSVTDYEMLRTRSNSFDGMPLELDINENQKDAFVEHVSDMPLPEDIVFTVLGCDTQTNPYGWYWVRRGYDQDLNSYLLGYGFCHSEAEVKALHKSSWNNIQKKFTIIDTGGTMRKLVYDLINECAKEGNIIGYRGAAASMKKRYDYHKENRRVIVANAKHYDVELLKKIYEHDDRSQGYWHLPDKETGKAIGEEGTRWSQYWHHMLAYQPNKRKGAEGESYENWEPKGARCDLFDCEKMILLVLDIYGDKLLAEDKKEEEEKKAKKSFTQIHRQTKGNWATNWKK